MTSRKFNKQNYPATSTRDEFVHECTCNLAVKQFRRDIKQLESATRTCNCRKTSTKQNRTPVKTANKTLPNTPSKNKTWFEVLAETPKKLKDDVIGCNSSCKYASIFTSELPKDDYMNKNKQFGLLMDILYKKIHESNDHELLNIIKEISNITSLKNADNRKHVREPLRLKSKSSSSYEYSRKLYSTDDQAELHKNNTLRKIKPTEKPKEKDDIKIKALIRLLENMQSVNEKTEIQQESLKNLTDLINKLIKENKMLNDLKDNRIALESKLASTITENKYLKERVELLESDYKRSQHLLELKEEEILSLKTRVGRIRETITRRIDFPSHPEMDHSITLDFDDTVATVPSSHENFDALIRPASSSPVHDYQKRVREEDDSGIQSNAQDDKKKLPNNYFKTAILELQDNVKKAMEEFKLDTRFNDISLDLSDATYKCSLSP